MSGNSRLDAGGDDDKKGEEMMENVMLMFGVAGAGLATLASTIFFAEKAISYAHDFWCCQDIEDLVRALAFAGMCLIVVYGGWSAIGLMLLL